MRCGYVAYCVVSVFLRIPSLHSELDEDKSNVNLVRTKRSDVSTCSSQHDCIPSSIHTANISDELISCVGSPGKCSCSECFQLYNDTCRVRVCWRFHESTSTCSDHRRSQTKTILISAFLSSLGAANFYIGRYVAGK